jgi:(2Fe-2S) ferredoxin
MVEIRNPGFDRSETQSLPGSVKLYHRHLIVCTGRADWPERIELDGAFIQALWEAITSRAPDMPLTVKLTACDEVSTGPGYDILVFPDQVRYMGVQEGDFPALVEDHLVGNRVSDQIQYQRLRGQHIFVCVHGARDERCGACGPPLVGGFIAALEARGRADQVAVRQSSHVGGHKYAGNVLVYPGGDWYGHVTPADVPRIVDQHILRDEIVWDLWRGRMGLAPDDQVQVQRREQ